MPAQSFVVYSAMKPVQGYALGPYYPLWVKGDDGTKTKNPKFDHHSQQILNLKQENTQWFKPAVKYCALHLATFLQQRNDIQFAEFVIIPSSSKDKVSAGLEHVVNAICKIDSRFSYSPHALRRHVTIEKLAKGGDRSLNVHLNSLEYRGQSGTPSLKIILDDVTTSGNSLMGAMTVIEQVMKGVTFLPLVLGRTTHD